MLQRVVEEICKDENVKDAVEQLIMSLSMVRTFSRIADPEIHQYFQVYAPAGEGAHVDLVLASANADANVRAIAVRDLYKVLANEEADDEEKVSELP